MITIGIETSCDETAASVVRDAREVLSNVVASQHELHVEYGGVVPEIASRAHAERLLGIVRESVRVAGVSLSDVDGVCVASTPGLIGALVIGVASAKALAWSLGVPIVGVDHIHAHLYGAFLCSHSGGGSRSASLDDSFPALGLVASGGHTSMYLMRSPIDIERIGSTIDDAVGEAFDKAGVLLGLAYPGGPALDRLASGAGANDRAHEFPVSRLSRDSLDFSFSGLKTSMLYAVRGVPGSRDGCGYVPLTEDRRRDLAASFQRAAVGALMLKIKRAIDAGDQHYRGLIVGGGVTANSRFRRELVELGVRTRLAVHVPSMEYCVDNAAMIAGLGGYMLSRGIKSDLGLSAQPTAQRSRAR